VSKHLVGRSTERRQVLEALAAVTAPGNAACVELVGQPGIGKTSLLADACEAATAAGCRVLRGGLSQAETELSWAGLATLVDDLLDDPSLGLPEPLLAPLHAALGRSQDAVDAGSVAFAFSSLLRTLAETGPLLIAVDDTQWLDRPTAAALTFAMRVRGPVLFLLARRPDEASMIDAARAIGGERVRTIELSGLTLAGVHEMVEQAGGRHPGRHDLVRLHELTGGNPLFVDRLARLLVDGGGLDSIDVPADLERALGAQLRGADAATMRLAGVVALAGRAPVELLQALCGDDYESAAAEAHSRRLTTERAGVLEMSHPLLRQLVAEQMRTPERRRLHRALAQHVKDLETRAWHLAEGAQGPDAVVAVALAEAAEFAEGRGAPAAAVALLLRAVDATPADDPRARWERQVAAGEAAVEAGMWPEAKELADAAYAGAPTIDDRRSVAWVRAVATHRVSSTVVTRQLFRDMLVELGDDATMHVRLLRGMAQVGLFDDVPHGLQIANEAMVAAAELGDTTQLLLTRSVQLQLQSLAGEPLDVTDLVSAIAAVTDDDDRSYLEERLVDLLRYTGDFEESMRLALVLLERARRSGDVTLLINCLSSCASAAELLGDLRGAVVFNEELMALPAQLDSAQDMAGALTSSCRLTGLLGGDISAMVTELERLVPNLAVGLQYEVFAEIGCLLTTFGDYSNAENWLDRAAATAVVWGSNDMRMLPIAHCLVESRVRLGDLDRAERVAKWAVAAAARQGAHRPSALAAKCMGLLAAGRGDREQAIVHFEDALAQFALYTDPLECAFTRLEYGVALRGARRRRDARVELDAALAMFVEMGVVAGARRTREELARIGDTPTGGANDLTATERRIAEMAAGGSTNSEIAAVLYINARTVESNLTRVYRKLGVRSRTELAAHAKSPGF